MGPEFTGANNTTTTSALDQFQQQAKETTNLAVDEGHRDVEAAKATGTGYVEQAKAIASNAYQTAQVCAWKHTL